MLGLHMVLASEWRMGLSRGCWQNIAMVSLNVDMGKHTLGLSVWVGIVT